MRNFINNIVKFSSGKKVYITGCVMIILGFLQGDKQLVFEGLGFIFLRQGIAKIKA